MSAGFDEVMKLSLSSVRIKYQDNEEEEEEIAYFSVRWKTEAYSLVYRTKNHGTKTDKHRSH